MSEVRILTVAEDEADVRLDRWLKRHVPGLGHGALQRLLRTGQVRVDGRRAKAGTRLVPGQAVRIPPLPPARNGDGGERPCRGRRPAPPVREEERRSCVGPCSTGTTG